MPKIVYIMVCAAFSAPTVCAGQAATKGQPPASGQIAPAGQAQPQPAAAGQPAPAQTPAGGSAQPELKPAPPTPIAVQKAELGDDDTWNPDWDKLIEKALPANLLSPEREGEVKSLCPRFKYLTDVDKRAFWAYFFQALAGAEAGLKPTANVRHKDPEVAVIDPVTKRVARQEGLLQLAYMDSERYGCDFDWNKDKVLPEHDPAKTILQPENNLLCGINILENQLISLRKPVLTKSSYWVTLRPGTYSFQLFMKQMSNEPEACGAPQIRRRWPWRRSRVPAALAANQPPAAGRPATASSSAGQSAAHTVKPAAAAASAGAPAAIGGSTAAAH